MRLVVIGRVEQGTQRLVQPVADLCQRLQESLPAQQAFWAESEDAQAKAIERPVLHAHRGGEVGDRCR